MKTDKEYPATHSMSTAWYIVDDDGNVGILDYNDNGPVPWGIEETYGSELKYGYEDSSCDIEHKGLRFNLTDEQILDLLSEPHKPSEETLWYDCAVRIDKKKTARFLKLCENDSVSAFCISENLGLYEFYAMDCAVDRYYNNAPIHGTLKVMLDEEIILEVYRTQMLDMDDEYNNGDVIHSKSFDNSPYFIFHQPYWTEFLPQKMHEPKHPVRISQIPEEFRQRIHKIPGRFSDMETFLIAQYYPCKAYSNEDPTYVVDGCSYQTAPLPDGSKVYTKISMYDYPFFPFCSEKERFRCSGKCSMSCCNINDSLFTDKPTALFIFCPKEYGDRKWKALSDIVVRNLYVTAYLPKFAYRTDKWYSLKEHVEQFMTDKYLSHLFRNSKGYVELIITDMNPRVILVTDRAYDRLKENYPVKSDTIEINGTDYPFYKASSWKCHSSVIEKLAQLPYQGKDHPLTITLEQMERLVKAGTAKVYKDILS